MGGILEVVEVDGRGRLRVNVHSSNHLVASKNIWYRQDTLMQVARDGGYHVVIEHDKKRFISLNCRSDFDSAEAFLCIRTPDLFFDVANPVCIGGVSRYSQERWEASITRQYNEDTDSDTCILGIFDSRIHAVRQLWLHRYEAYAPQLQGESSHDSLNQKPFYTFAVDTLSPA